MLPLVDYYHLQLLVPSYAAVFAQSVWHLLILVHGVWVLHVHIYSARVLHVQHIYTHSTHFGVRLLIRHPLPLPELTNLDQSLGLTLRVLFITTPARVNTSQDGTRQGATLGQCSPLFLCRDS